LITSVFSTISSRAKPSLLAVTCIIAVIYDIGLKRPLIQIDFGAIKSSLYYSSCLILSIKSSYHIANVLFEKYAYFIQISGYWLMKIEFASFSISSVIFNEPFRPASKSSNVYLIVSVRMFILSHSYRHTTTNGDLSFAFVLRSIILKKGGRI
jgi:hypothetical protein